MDENRAVVRMWRGAVRTEETAQYVAYVERTGMRAYRSTPGNLDAWILTRDLGDGTTEIVTVSRWDSLASIRGFAGDDIDVAVFYPVAAGVVNAGRPAPEARGSARGTPPARLGP